MGLRDTILRITSDELKRDVPADPVQSMLETLQKASHGVTTAYGVSKQTYSKNMVILYHGVGQGNGAEPAIWAVISTVIIAAMMATAGHGFHSVCR